jgi:hypothetical protein
MSTTNQARLSARRVPAALVAVPSRFLDAVLPVRPAEVFDGVCICSQQSHLFSAVAVTYFVHLFSLRLVMERDRRPY